LPAARGFIAAYRARFRAEPGAYSATGYAAAEVALAAIRGALVASHGALPSRDDVLARVAATRNLVTPVGPVAFDSAGDLRNPTISLYEVRDGRERFVEAPTVRPLTL
jgi:branched-chain amino acid transport system substrate-binding protein